MKNFSLYIFIIFFTFQVQAQTQKGGFVYGWDNYSLDEDTGLGSRPVIWDSTDLVDIVHAPAVGIHPRVYFGPSEIPGIKNRLDNTASGQSVKAQIHAYTTLMHLGTSYSQNATYAKDADGNRYIDNSGAWNMEPFYTKLKNQDPSVWTGVPIKSRHRTASFMAMEAFTCLLYPLDNDLDVGLDYATRAQDLADAMYFWAQLAIADPSVSPNGQNFNLFGGTHMALAYDLNYNNLSPMQRDTIRFALTKIIPNHPRHGGGTKCYANTSNWSTLNTFEIVTNLAIEGEPGYKSQMTEEWMRAYHTFINYGWYPSGAGYEGLGKNYQFVTTMIVCAKRGYSLLSHPNVRAYGENFLPAIMQPFGRGFTSYDVWGGSGYDPVTGEYKFNAADAVGLKWAFPNSQKIDFVWKNYIRTFHQNDSEGYVYAQVIPDDSYNNYLIPAAVFASDYSNDSWQNGADQAIETDFVAMDRGLAVFKSGTDTNSMAMQFHARQDMGGHTHGDRLDFTLSSHGRIWVRKSYGGSQFQPSKFHSMVLVDDLGVPVGDPDGDKCRQPATVLDYRITDSLSSISADATYAYNWEWHWSPQNPGNDHPWLGTNGWEAVTETWNDFLVNDVSEAHYDIPFYDFGHWTQAGKLERMVKREYNTLEKVVRNVGMIKRKYPMLLTIDDVKKDSLEHNYKWIAQIARDLEFDAYDINLVDSNYKCDIILKESAATGNRKILFRILENTNFDGTTNPGYIDSVDYVNYFNGTPYNSNPNWERQRLIVESNSISPNFKVLMYPFNDGDELPVTHWNSSRDTLDINFSDEENKIYFEKDNEGNTQFDFVVYEVEEPIDTTSDTTSVNSINDINAIESVQLYPNPASSKVTVSAKNIQSIRMYSLEGKLIFHTESINTDKSIIDISNLTKGVYFIKTLLGNGKEFNLKLVVN